MKIRKSCVLTVTMSLAFSAGAALTLSNDEFQSAKRGLTAEFAASKKACKSSPGKTIALCRAEANRDYQVANARLEAMYKPSRDGTYKARVAIADAEYLVARRKCDGKVGNVKNLCVKEARAVLIASKADANAPEDASIATRAVNIRANAARRALREEEERTEARRDTEAERRITDIQISKEKCETMPGDAKLACLKGAEKRFGQL